jgi:PKD repeat protein
MRTILVFLIISLFVGFSLKAQTRTSTPPALNDTSNYPYWIEMMQDPSVNFFKVQKAFNTYWKDRPITKGCGWKPFKRWEYMMMSRINPDGSRPAADETFRAYMTMKKNVRSSNGNWISEGPAEIPAPGPAGYEGLGRLNVVAFHPTDANKIYVGAPSGGMWQSSDGGQTWESHTDTLPTLGVSAIIVDKTNPSIILIGTGDRDAGDAPGMGVLISTDGGQTWSFSNTGMGNQTVGKLLQHPANTQILLAATSGGVYRSTNGGANWTQSKSGNFKDIVFKPGDPNTVYAAAGANFWRSADNGVSFTQITSGLSGGQRGTIAVTAANAGYVYFLVSGNDSGFKGFYRSTDSGLNFTTRSTSPNILDWSCDGSGSGGQGWYDLAVAANPLNAEDVYAGGVDVWRSTNGGTTWTINSHWYGGCSVPAVHADCHFLGYSPVDGQLYAGNDGGIYTTNDNGVNWTDHTVGMTIGQIYKLGQSQTLRDKVIHGFQDNGTYTHLADEWVATGGGDGMECAVDQFDASYTYHTIYYGDIYRKKNNANEKHIAGNGTYGIDESGAWVTPFILHETNPKTMFVGYKNIWRCTNVKANSLTWVKISDNLAGSNGSDLAVLEQSPADTNVLYAVRYDNKMFRTDNCNAAVPVWTDLTSDLPTSGTPSDVEASPFDANIVYITMGNNIYKSTDKGLNWTVISANLVGIHLNSIAYYKNSAEALYVGTDAGVYYKDLSMTDWIPFSQGLPANGRVTEVEIFYDNDSISQDLISACTYGRGFWQSDLYHAGPVADFTADKTLIPKGCDINFTDLSTGTPTNWEWTFTGGTPPSSTVKNPLNIFYNTPGTFQVKMKAWNELGSDSITKTDYITVSNTLTPLVIFGSDKNILCMNEIVHFYDSTQNCPISWHWQFAPGNVTFLEGTTAYSQNPVVQFNQTGSFSVTLTATNNVGSSTVTKPGYILYGGYTLPFTEGFESGFNSKYWTIVNSDSEVTWDTITLSASAGGKVAWINFFDYLRINKRDQLISAPMNFSDYTTLHLNFDHAYAQRSTIKDSLIVLLSADCGNTWTRILAAGPDYNNPNVFATHANTVDAFYPLSAEDWCGSSFGTACYSLDISAWAGQTNVKIMFESFNRHGNNLFLDNIEIDGPVGIPGKGKGDLGIRIYPNPSNGIFNLYIEKGANDIDISIFDLHGQKVYSEKNLAGMSNITKELNLSELSKGVYYIRLTTEDVTQVEKIIIN